VYLAQDEQLERLVAVKVPHRHLISQAGSAEVYLAEARMVARLDHPHIVPVHDVGSTDQIPCFIVSKYIDGTDLAARLRDARPRETSLSFHTAAELIATVADALHYAHKLGLVHRDIKPGNILLDRRDRPYLADFGIALREQDIGKGARCVGTPAYMSPEQARGEGHRVDGRSDIFSLGIVLYRLLTGSRPFRGSTDAEQLQEIIHAEVRPPRQIDDQIPRELERICLKSLAKRACERYTTALDMAEDLRHVLRSTAVDQLTRSGDLPAAPTPAIAPAIVLTPVPPGTLTPASAPPPVTIVPRGLRSFDAQDADFFLELLAGPRDREGLPDSIGFWKRRIEEPDADQTFAVGLIYGPSGCGKSSLVKAGLLPRLRDGVTTVYVEATADDTESRLLSRIRKQCPGLPASLSLTETLAGLRRGYGLSETQKILLVVDQFEQWLHVVKVPADTELVAALRHCDGAHLQCIVMVRDDFWLKVSRFMRDLEVDLLSGRNIALVDLFDVDHARKVLAAFGRAFGKLPERWSEAGREQKDFLDRAIVGLARDEKVICVQLAIFAEMMKGRPWTVATLKEVGGTEGLGVAFLEDTFFSATANPKHRLHRQAAQAVLRALLPEPGSSLKGHMRSEADLLAASGYADRPREFEELMRVLDGELRLVTPTDPEGSECGAGQSLQPAGRYYLLTHDYLVDAVREWLTRKQKETRRGRAELQLAERADLWNAKPLNRHLPSPLEWLRMRFLTRCGAWTPAQRRMMRRTDAYYLIRSAVLAALVGLVVWGVWEHNARVQAEALRERLVIADMAQVPAILTDVDAHRRHVDPLLHTALAEESDPRKKLRLALALSPADPGQVQFLYEQLLHAAPQDFAVIRQVLARYQDEIRGDLWQELAVAEPRSERRFRAACALLEYAADDPRWPDCAALVVDGLIAESPLALIHWRNALGGVKDRLLRALAVSLADSKWNAADRRAIIEFYRLVAAADGAALEPLRQRLAREDTGTATERARRKATLLAALAALGEREHSWPLLVHTRDPMLRSFLMLRLGSSGIDPQVLKDRLDIETDVSARRALILVLGAFPSDRLPGLSAFLRGLHASDPDAGIHAATEWVLRGWKQQEPAAPAAQTPPLPNERRTWYVNSQHQTFSVITGPGSLRAGADGAPPRPTHCYAVGATEVTVQQYRAFRPEHEVDLDIATTVDSPVMLVSWYDAAAYCNWLSERDEITKTEWCYQKMKDGRLDVVPDYQKRTGYRLPTEGEWEFACRAGAKTSCSFGELDEELAADYAWWFGNVRSKGVNHSFPVALLRPNDWGLFDMHGNAAEWCQELAKAPRETGGGRDIIASGRSSSYNFGLNALRIEEHWAVPRNLTFRHVGFRVVRTLQ
jgi:serine/threonine protein kinase